MFNFRVSRHRLGEECQTLFLKSHAFANTFNISCFSLFWLFRFFESAPVFCSKYSFTHRHHFGFLRILIKHSGCWLLRNNKTQWNTVESDVSETAVLWVDCRGSEEMKHISLECVQQRPFRMSLYGSTLPHFRHGFACFHSYTSSSLSWKQPVSEKELKKEGFVPGDTWSTFASVSLQMDSLFCFEWAGKPSVGIFCFPIKHTR